MLSVPITHKIVLCTYQGYQFGVFGYCDVKTGECSKIGIGYDGAANISLPSNARQSLSNLLIVHVVAAGLSFFMFLFLLVAHFHGPQNSTKYFLFLLLFALLTFVISLLAFLADILLFVSHLAWAGWIVLAATVLIALSGVMIWITHRTLSSKRELKVSRFDDLAEMNTFSHSTDPFARASNASFTNILKSDDNSTALRYQSTNTTSGNPEEIPLTNQQLDNSFVSTASTLNDRTPSPSAEYRYGRNGYVAAGQPEDLNLTDDFSGSRRKRTPVVPAGTYLPDIDRDHSQRQYRGAYGPSVPRMRPVYSQSSQGYQVQGPQGYPGPQGYQTLQGSQGYHGAPGYTSQGYSPQGSHGGPLNTGGPQFTLRGTPGTRPINGDPSLPNVGDPEELEDLPQQVYPGPRTATPHSTQDGVNSPSYNPGHASPQPDATKSPHHQLRQYFVEGNEATDEPQMERNGTARSPPPVPPAHGSAPGTAYRHSYIGEASNPYGTAGRPIPPQQQGCVSPHGVPPHGISQSIPSQNYSAPRSDSERYETPSSASEASHYTSISQRETQRSPPVGPTRSEFALQNNPDFQVNRPLVGRNKGRPPPAFASNDGPYGSLSR